MRNTREVTTRTVLASALLGPLAAYATAIGLTLAIVLGVSLPIVAVAVVVLWLIALALRARIRRRRLQPLLRAAPIRVSEAEFSDLALDFASAPSSVSTAADPTFARRLASRRLLVLSSHDELGAHEVYSNLKARFSSYRLVEPRRSRITGQPPLTELLSSDLLPLRGRFILVLGDAAGLVDTGFDPRLVERWLAGGRGRVAICWLSPTDRARILNAGTHEGLALARSDFVDRDEARVSLTASRQRFQEAASLSPAARAILRISGAAVALGALPLEPEALLASLPSDIAPYATEDVLDRLCAGEQAPLRREQSGLVVATATTAEIVDIDHLSEEIPSGLLEALVIAVTPDDLVRIAIALAYRDQVAEAHVALAHARARDPGHLQPAINRASMHILDVEDGSSGARLTGAGGLDFAEQMGPTQRRRASHELAPQSDGIFDSSLPNEFPSRAERFYRLTYRRALVRLTTLIGIDAVALAIASADAIVIRTAVLGRTDGFLSDYARLLPPTVVVSVVLGVWLGLYRANAPRARIHLILAQLAGTTLIVMVGFFVADVDAGTILAVVALFGIAFAIEVGLRALYDVVSRRWVRKNHLQPRALLLGPVRLTRTLALNMTAGSERPVQPVAFLAPTPCADQFCIGTYANLSAPDELAKLRKTLEDLHIAELAIADTSLSTSTKASVIAEAQRLGLDVRFAASDEEIILGAVGGVGDHGLVYVPAALMTPERLELKRFVDSALVYASLPGWGLILAFYALYTRLCRRGQPVIVYAHRVGLGETAFSMLRLRTRHLHDDGTRGAEASGRVESFFELTGLDELPQTINVLRHEMSLVGPRPLSVSDATSLTVDQRRTFGARPGMTGRWQIAWPRGASEAAMRTLDADYLRRWRIVHDVEILLRTPIAIVRRRHAFGDTRLRVVRDEPDFISEGAPTA